MTITPIMCNDPTCSREASWCVKLNGEESHWCFEEHLPEFAITKPDEQHFPCLLLITGLAHTVINGRDVNDF